MSLVSDAIDRIVTADLAKRLKQQGFARFGRNYSKPHERAVVCLNVQGSQWNRGAGGRFTINLGVYFPELSRILDDTSPEDRPTIVSCPMCLQERLPGLALGRDIWWEVEATDNAGLWEARLDQVGS